MEYEVWHAIFRTAKDSLLEDEMTYELVKANRFIKEGGHFYSRKHIVCMYVCTCKVSLNASENECLT